MIYKLLCAPAQNGIEFTTQKLEKAASTKPMNRDPIEIDNPWELELPEDPGDGAGAWTFNPESVVGAAAIEGGDTPKTAIEQFDKSNQLDKWKWHVKMQNCKHVTILNPTHPPHKTK